MAAFSANLGIAVSKFVGFVITGSAGLLAEAVHSLADTGNQGLLLLGNKKADKEPTGKHPFGYGRERYFWAFVVALVLFTLGGVFAIVEGIDKLRHPHSPEGLGWAIGILIFAMALESYSFRTAIHESNSVRRGAGWMSFLRHARTPELPLVLLEDAGALIGLVLALAGVILAKITDNGRWDAAGSLGIGVLLCLIAAFLAVEMKSLLIGESALPRDQHRIAEAMVEHPLVTRLIHLRTEHIGPEELLVGAKVEFEASLTVAALAAAIDGVERNVRAAVPTARIIYIEPDVLRPSAEVSAT